MFPAWIMQARSGDGQRQAEGFDANVPRRRKGTGAYYTEGWKKGDPLILKRNPNYWKSTPGIDEVDDRVRPGRQHAHPEAAGRRDDIIDFVPFSQIDASTSSRTSRRRPSHPAVHVRHPERHDQAARRRECPPGAELRDRQGRDHQDGLLRPGEVHELADSARHLRRQDAAGLPVQPRQGEAVDGRLVRAERLHRSITIASGNNVPRSRSPPSSRTSGPRSASTSISSHWRASVVRAGVPGDGNCRSTPSGLDERHERPDGDRQLRDARRREPVRLLDALQQPGPERQDHGGRPRAGPDEARRRITRISRRPISTTRRSSSSPIRPRRPAGRSTWRASSSTVSRTTASKT